MTRRISQTNRVLLAVGTMAVLALSTAGIAEVIIETERASIARAADELAVTNTLARELTNVIHDAEAALGDYLLSGDDAALARYDTAIAAQRRLLSELEVRVAPDTPVGSAVDAVFDASLAWQVNVARPAISAVTIGDQATLARFDRLWVDDFDGVEGADARLGEQLGFAQDALDARAAAAMSANEIASIGTFVILAGAAVVALLLVRRYGGVLERGAVQSGIVNRFTEVSSFAIDDREVADTNLVALAHLVRPDGAVTHVHNRSKDRAFPEASMGDATAEVLPMHTLGRCPGMVRGTMWVTDDLSDDMSVHCPVYPAATGTLACVPLNSGEAVGAVHLYWTRPNAFPLTSRVDVARVSEHAALAIGNRRLLAALHGQANTDPRTGLANSRAFDQAVEEALATRMADEPIAVLMLDVDHFKAFNDRHGHPAGDEALRTFARVLGSCMREGDLAARYGGEEFAVLLPHVDAPTALAIGERIRVQTESTIISLAPGITDRITVSIGVATAPEQGLERVALLRIADEALYDAKSHGRNRVVHQGVSPVRSDGDAHSEAPVPTAVAGLRPHRAARQRRVG